MSAACLKHYGLTVLCLALFASVMAAKASGPMVEELRRVESIALKNNLGLRSTTYETRASHSKVLKSQGIYDPRAKFEFGVWRENEHGNSFDHSGDEKSDTRYSKASLIQRLPTGGELVLSAQQLREHENTQVPVNPSYENSLRIGFVQPLLNGFGKESTERETTLSTFERSVAIEKLRDEAATLLVQVREAYFKVLQLREERGYRDSSLKLAKEIWAQSRAKVEAGVFKPIESLEAEVGLLRRENEKLDTEKAYLDALDELSSLLGGKPEIKITARIEQLPRIDLDESKALRNAVSNRPELLQKMIEIKKTGFEKKLSEKDLLPKLNLVGGYGRMGLGNDLGDSLDDLSGDGHNSWQIGLSLSLPLGNNEGKGELLKTNNILKGQQAKLDQFLLGVRNEIRKVARLVQLHDEKIALATREQELAAKKLQNLLQLYNEGLVTTRQILEGEEELAKSRIALTTAKISFNNAITNFMNAVGMLFENAEVAFPDLTSISSHMPTQINSPKQLGGLLVNLLPITP